MFKNNLSEIFPFVHNLYDISELILVGSDVPSWLNIVSGYDLEKVHYINQSDKNYNFDSLPLNWQVSSKLLAKEDGDTTFYSLSNPMLNGTVSSDILVNLWQNLKTLKTTQKEAVSLKTFIEKECSTSGSKMVVVDSFDGLFLLNELDSLQIDAIALRIIADDDKIFANVSETKVKQKLQECGYKNIATYEDNHPKIKTAVYVKDVKRQTREYEENLNSVKQNTQKEFSEIKTQLENKTKELATANQTKEQELAKLKNELETKNKVLQEKQANSEQLQKQKTELEKKTKTLEENLIKEKTANENLQKELSSSKAELELKTQEFAKNLKRELKESEYILKQATKLVGIEDFSIVSLAEISQNAKDYRKAIQYWQQLASKLENKMPQIFYRRLLQAYEKIGGFPKGSEEEEQLKGSLDKHEVLRELHEILHPNLYLEIGVQTGKSLKLAECRAIGIDPMPMIKFELGINHELIEESSDNFFKTKAATILTEPIDFSFIDGMHLFEYALRDFMNVEKYSTKDTIVVMDDIYPGHEAQASRDRKTRAWTGDVWKIVSILKKYRPDLKITLLDLYPTGLMIIENLNNKNNILSQNYKKIVKKYMNKKINNEKYINRTDSIKLEKLEELRRFEK